MNLDFLLKRAIAFVLLNHPGCKNIILTGSAATARRGNAGDLDLIVLDPYATHSSTYNRSEDDLSMSLDILVIPKFEIASYIRKTFVSNNSVLINMMINGVVILDEDHFAHEAILFVQDFLKEHAQDQVRKATKMAIITIQKAIGSINRDPADPVNTILVWKIANALIQLRVSKHYPVYVNSDKQNAKLLLSFEPDYFDHLMAIARQSVVSSDYSAFIQQAEGDVAELGGFVMDSALKGPKRRFSANDPVLFAIPFSEERHGEILRRLAIIEAALSRVAIQLLFVSCAPDHSLLHTRVTADSSFEEVNHRLKNVLLALNFPPNTIRASHIADTAFLPYALGGTLSFTVIHQAMQEVNRFFIRYSTIRPLDAGEAMLYLPAIFIDDLIKALFRNAKIEVLFIDLLADQWLTKNYYALHIAMGYQDLHEAKVRCEALIQEGLGNDAGVGQKLTAVFGEVIGRIVSDMNQIDPRSVQFTRIETRVLNGIAIGGYNAHFILFLARSIELILSFFGIVPADRRSLQIIGYLKEKRHAQPQV